ncbi:4-aminobutyrate--2-oxoglutarate transaminase [soil metagenome]
MNTDTLTPEKASVGTRQNDELFERRKAVVANGVGIFCPVTVSHAKNSTLTDVEGNELIDFAGGIGVLNAGHCPEPVIQAIQQQAEKLIHSCFHIATYEVYIQLCEKLAEILPHGDATKVMLTNTGAEAVENAIKIARQATQRPAVICFTEAFHGRSLMAMSLTSKINYKLNCGPFAPEVYRLTFPDLYHYRDGLSEDEFVKRELKKLEDATHSLVEVESVAAIILELVQGEGGFNIVPKKYVEGLREFCDRNGIMLIFDEVQTGFCRTGKWGAYEHYNVTPDLSTWAKSMGSGMPIGAVIGKQHIMDAAVPGTIGGTYLGNPVCCAASLATIEFMEKEDLNRKATEISRIVESRFLKMKNKFSCIGDVRGLGAMQAIEFVKNNDPSQPDSELVSKLTQNCLDRGLLIITAGTYKNVIRILSPLVISHEQLNKGLDIMEEELQKIVK